MNIRSKIKNLFMTNSNTNIINMRDAFVMPKKEDFTSYCIELINKEKEEYLKVIKEKKILTSSELNNKNLREEINLNTSLVLNIFMNETSDKDKMVLIAKLNIYLSVIESLRKEVLSKIIALNEIKKEKILLNKHKKEVIKLELDNLINTYIMLDAQIKAITKEKETFFNSYLINFKESNNEELINRLEYLRELKSFIATENIKETPKDKTSIIVETAFIERELEIYAYKNKDKVNEVLKIIEENNSITLDNIDAIENELLIFKEFSNSNVTDNILLNFYKIKLGFSTSCIYSLTNKEYSERINNLILSKNGVAKSYYEKIIEEKVLNISDNLKDKITFAKTKQFKELYNIIKDFLKSWFNDGTNKFVYFNILNDRRRMAFLLSLEKNYSITYFVNNFLLSNSEYNFKNLNNYKGLITWHEKIPLITYYKCSNVLNDTLFNICFLYEKYIETSYYQYKYLPEGIKFLDFTEISETMFKNIIEKYNNKHIVFPSSLITIKTDKSDFKYNTKFASFDFKEGLKIIEADPIKCASYSVNTVMIPSSLIEWKGVSFHLGKTIVFKNYTKSHILHNYHALSNCILEILFFEEMILMDDLKYSIKLKKLEKIFDYCINSLNLKCDVNHFFTIKKLNEEIEKVTGRPLFEDDYLNKIAKDLNLDYQKIKKLIP